MLFNSYEFLLAAFPLSLIIYFLLNKAGFEKTAKFFLILFSLYFYGYFNWSYLFIICGSILFNYFISKKCEARKNIAAVGVICNIAVIFIYKYYDFFIDNINHVFLTDIPLLHLLLPLGISFFTFQQISYLIDSYHGATKEDKFLEYALFVSFFPQLIAGPIVLREEMLPQFRDKVKNKFSCDNFSKGMFFMTTGLAKKVLLADTIAVGVNWGFANISSLTGISAILTTLFYSFQLYFDFSGYCDMAAGIAYCFNFELTQNFDSPYQALSISDFWRRWHMSLSRFLTRYIYIPLGGNRKGEFRTMLNIMIVFLISGIWHGAGWTYIVWGVMHGIASVINRCIAKWWKKVPHFVSIVLTFLFCNFAWIFFRAEKISDAIWVIRKIFVFDSRYFKIPRAFSEKYKIMEFSYLQEHIGAIQDIYLKLPSMYLWIMFIISVFLIWGVENSWRRERKTTGVTAILCAVLWIWSLVSLSNISTFLYFNF